MSSLKKLREDFNSGSAWNSVFIPFIVGILSIEKSQFSVVNILAAFTIGSGWFLAEKSISTKYHLYYSLWAIPKQPSMFEDIKRGGTFGRKNVFINIKIPIMLFLASTLLFGSKFAWIASVGTIGGIALLVFLGFDFYDQHLGKAKGYRNGQGDNFND